MKLPNNNFTIFILLLYSVIILGSFKNNQTFERYTREHDLRGLKVENKRKPLMEQVKSEISLQNEREMKKSQEKKNKSEKHETIGRILQTRKDGELKSDNLEKGKIDDLEPPRMGTSCRPLKSDFVEKLQSQRGEKLKPINTKERSRHTDLKDLKEPQSTGSYLRTHGHLKSDFVGESQLLHDKKIKPITTKDLYYHTEDLKQPNSTSSYFRTYGHPNSDLVEESKLLIGEKMNPIDIKERSRHTDLKEPQSTGSYLRTKGTLKYHFAEESKIEAKEKPITMKASDHNYTINELKQPHTASSYFRTQRSQTKLHSDIGDPQIGPSLKSIRTKPKENVENKSHKIEGGQAKTPSSTSSLLRKLTAPFTHGNTKVTPSHKHKYERHQSNGSEKSSISSSNYSIMSGGEKYSTSSRSSLLDHLYGESLHPSKNDTELNKFDFNLGDNLSRLSKLRLKPNKNEEKLTQEEKTSNPKSPFSRFLSSITPRSLTPKNLTPRSLTPTNLTPRSLTPNFSSTKHYEKIKSYERGNSSTRVVLSSEVTHLDCLNPRKLKKDKKDKITLINFKSYFAKRDPFTLEYKEVESSVRVFLNEMIGKGGVAEVYRGIFCDGRKEIKVGVKLFGFNTTRINSRKLKDLFADPKNEMGIFEAFEKFYDQGYSQHSGIVKMFDGGEIQNIEYSADEENKHDFKYVIITELGGNNFLKYIGGKIREGKLSESELMNELVKPATFAIHMDFKPQNLVFDSKNNLKAIDFGGSIPLHNGKSRSDKIQVERKTTSSYFMPPEINTALKNELYDNYDPKDECATTKTDIWEFGILIFQIILLNDNHLSMLEFDKWINDVSTIEKINKFFTYLFYAQDRIIYNPKKFEETIKLLLVIMIEYPSLFILATNLLHRREDRRLSAKGIRDFLTSQCRISKKSKSFESFLEAKFIDENEEEFGIMTQEHEILLGEGQKKLKELKDDEKMEMRECDRN